MPELSNRQTVEKFYTLLNAARFDELATLVDPNIILEWPQSGERIRGAENNRAVMENFPDPPVSEVQRVAGAEDKWVMTPMFSPLRISGTGDVYTVETRINYPSGEVWRGVDIMEFTNGRISKMTGYFAAPFPAAEWRSRWVEKMDDPAQVKGKRA